MDNQVYLRNVATLEYDSSKCIGCKMCIEVCPHNVFRMMSKKAVVVNKDKCMECGACEINCITHALKVKQGVGCAAAVITGFIRGTEATCDCNCGPSCN
ncbi:MAG: mercury methylation ferredoxin HgcB [Bacteroidales bacterium]|nr:mercury methylation ferredoxin HgcB [Bacteroidales bacterium]